MDDEEEGALLGVEEDEQDLKEEIGLVQTQDPGAAQNDKLGHDLEQNQSVEKRKKKNLMGLYCHGRLLRHHHSQSINASRLSKNEFVPGVFGLRNVAFHVGQSRSETPQSCTEQSPVELREEKES